MVLHLPHETILDKENTAFSLLKEKLSSVKYLDFEVTSNFSMFPFLNRGDTLSVKNVKLQDLKKGDIIVFKNSKNLCVHRYVGMQKKDNGSMALIAKGDNICYFDRLPISEEQLIGKVILIKRNKKIINLESAFWKIVNRLLAKASSAQASAPDFLKFLRITFLGNNRISPKIGAFAEQTLFFIFSIFLKFIVYITKAVPLFYKKPDPEAIKQS